jgi:hypothetical protein
MRFVEVGSLGVVMVALGVVALAAPVVIAQGLNSASLPGAAGRLFQAASVNRAPQMDPLPDRTIDEETTLSFVVVASDPDEPAQTLTFRLGAGALTGATINTNSGLFTWTPTEGNGPGTVPFSVIVTDDGSPSMSATQRFTVFVREANRPPVIAPISEQTFNEGELVVVSVFATDPDLPLQSLTYSLGAGAPEGAAVNESGLFTWTPSEAQAPGTNVILAIATDNGSPSLSVTQQFTIIVREVNYPPAVPAIGQQSVNEGELLAFTIPATDPDLPAQSLTYSLGGGAADGASVNPTNGLFTWVPAENQGPGSYFFAVIVTDSGSPPLSEAQGFLVVVNEVNRPPELPAIPNRTVNEGESLAFSIFATDSDVPTQNLIYSLGPGAPDGASISGGGFFFWTPGEAQGPATNEIAIIVMDTGAPSLNATQRFTVIVQEINHAPVLAAVTDRTVNEGDLVSFTAQATDVNLPAQNLTFTLGAGAPTGASIDPQSGAFTWTPAEAQGPGSYLIGVIVTDDGSPPASAAQSFTVTVNEVNQQPVLLPLADQVVNQGGFLVFTVPASDADAPSQTLSFSLGPGAPAGAGISADGLFTWAPSQAQVFTTNRISVVVSDGSLTATQAFTAVVLEANLAPVLGAITNRTVVEGEAISFTAQASDGNGLAQTLTFSLGAGAPAGASIDPQTGAFTWTPSEAQGGTTNVIGVLVTDDGIPALGAAQSFTVIVEEINEPPVLAPVADQTVNQGGFLVFSLAATDPDLPTQPLAFTLGAGAPTGAVVSASGLFTWTPSQAQAFTTNRLKAIVSDGSLTATQSFTVVVLEANLLPTLAAITDYAVREGDTVTFTAVADDPNLPTQTLTFTLGAGAPPGASIDPQSGIFTWTPSEAQGGTTNLIGIVVTDNGTPPLGAARSFTVTVEEIDSPPVLPPLADQTVNQGGLLVFSIPADDPDIPERPLTFSLGAGAPAGAAVSTAGLFTWTPSQAQASTTNLLKVMVSDGSLSATQSFTVVVLEPNLAPRLAAITNLTVNEGETVTFKVEATDANLPAQHLTFTLGAGAPSGAGIDAQTGVFTWTPGEAQGGSTNVLGVIVTDDGTPSLGAAQSFTIVVREINSPPVLPPLANQTVNLGGFLVFTIPASDPDIPTQSLAFSLGTGAPAGAVVSAEGLFTWTPSQSQAFTTNTLKAIVTDGSLSSTQSFTVIVLEANLAPRLVAITNYTILEGEALTFNVEASDANRPAQHLTYALGAGAPSGASIDPQTGLFTWTPGETQGGSTNVIGVLVTDDGTPSLSAGVSFTVVVREVSSPPVLPPIPDQTVNEGGLLVFTIPASDPDIPVQPLSFRLGQGSPGGARVTEDGLFTWEPRPSQVLTTNRLSVIVTDGTLSATQSFTVVVLEVNLAPTLAAITNRSVNEGELVMFMAEAADANQPAQSLTFSLGAGTPAGASINSTNGLFTWTPDESQGPGTNQIGVIVIDNGTPPLSAVRSFTITVREVNRPPAVAPIPEQGATPGNLLVFKATASDPDLPAQPLTFSLGAGAPTGAAISPGGLFTWIPTQAQASTTNRIGVIAFDGSLTATQSLTVIVLSGALTPPRLVNPAFIANTFSASVDSLPGRRYFLERNVALAPSEWRATGEFLGIGGMMSLTDPFATNAHSSYRARVQ